MSEEMPRYDDCERDYNEEKWERKEMRGQRGKSVLDFNRDDYRNMESMTVKEINTEDLLKILVCRGEDEKNPIISGGVSKVLRQINREPAPRRSDFRSGRRGGRGRGRGRGQRKEYHTFDNSEE